MGIMRGRLGQPRVNQILMSIDFIVFKGAAEAMDAPGHHPGPTSFIDTAAGRTVCSRTVGYGGSSLPKKCTIPIVMWDYCGATDRAAARLARREADRVLAPEPRDGVSVVYWATAAPMPANPSLARRLEAWKAVPCLSGAWLVPAPTTARTLYDSQAPSARDEDRLLVNLVTGYDDKTQLADVYRKLSELKQSLLELDVVPRN